MTEFELIELITRGLDRSTQDLSAGVGDDCAVIAGPSGRQWLITTDLLVEGVHFDLDHTDLATLGRKALSVNVSDIAAMAGVPRFWLSSIAIPTSIGPDGAGLLYKGMRSAADEHGALLIGGDTSSSPSGLLISITAVGECAAGRAVLRSGARPGDAIYVTGELGGSALGFELLERGVKEGEAARFIRRHNDPVSRVKEARLLAAGGAITSMIDVSDGLMADLGHIADASNVGFELNAWRAPFDPSLPELAAKVGANPVDIILAGGEDYELAFTVAESRVIEFERDVVPGTGISVTRIGTIVKDRALRRALLSDGSEAVVKRAGFDHFRGRT